MLSVIIQSEIDFFLDGVSRMTVEDFAAVREHSLAAFPTQQEARPAMKLPAADLSWIEKRARDTIGPLLVALPWPGARLSSAAAFLPQGAGKAIACRSKLSEEQYEAFVGGFRQVGVAVPDHRPAG